MRIKSGPVLIVVTLVALLVVGCSSAQPAAEDAAVAEEPVAVPGNRLTRSVLLRRV